MDTIVSSVILVIAIFIFIAILSPELAVISVDGLPANKAERDDIEKSLLDTSIKKYLSGKHVLISKYDWGIDYIADVEPLSILFKYYHSSKGPIWRYSSLSRKIDQKVIDLKIEKLHS